MIKKGLKLFTTSPSFVEVTGIMTAERENVPCCVCCTSPFFGLCKPVCKYRKATYAEFIENALKG